MWCVTLHDLRRTFSSKCAEWQVASPDIIERLLGHTTALSPIARVYNRWHYLPEMRTALERYEKKLAELLAS
jgi:integrase